jgi:hypothetical protein
MEIALKGITCTTAVWKVRGLTLFRVGTWWRCGDGLFFEVPPLTSDALLTTLHPLLENVLQTVCRKLQEDSGTGAVLGLPLRGSSFTFVSPTLKNFHHLKTAARLITSSPSASCMCYRDSDPLFPSRTQNSIAQRCCSAILKRVFLKQP